MKKSTKNMLRGVCGALSTVAVVTFLVLVAVSLCEEANECKPEPAIRQGYSAPVPEADLVQLWPQSTPDEPEIVEHVEPTEPAILRVLATSTIIVMPDGTEQSLLGLIRKLERVERLAVEQWHPERQGISP